MRLSRYRRWSLIALASAVIAITRLASSSAWAAGPRGVAYFYNLSNSAAPVGAIIKGKTTVTVKPVAPGHLSVAIRLPQGVSTLGPAPQKQMQAMGLPIPHELHLVFHSKGGDTSPQLPLQLATLGRGSRARVLIYAMYVKTASSAPAVLRGPAFAVTRKDIESAAAGKAPVAVLDELTPERDSAGADVWFRSPEAVFDEGDGSYCPAVTFAQGPGRYDVLQNTGTTQLAALRAQPSIATLKPGDFHKGHIAVYVVTRKGKLTHVMDLPRQ